jgi:hypothetical protein
VGFSFWVGGRGQDSLVGHVWSDRWSYSVVLRDTCFNRTLELGSKESV